MEVIYIQAKRWKPKVGRPEIQSFVGAIAGKKAGKGIFITTSDFHDNAREYAASLHQKLVLIDGRRLAELTIEHNIGVAPEQPYIIKKIGSDYFEQRWRSSSKQDLPNLKTNLREGSLEFFIAGGAVPKEWSPFAYTTDIESVIGFTARDDRDFRYSCTLAAFSNCTIYETLDRRSGQTLRFKRNYST